MDDQKTVRKTLADEYITLPDLWNLCLARWNWFVLSLLVCVGVACYYLMKAPKMYTREVAVLVKQEVQGKNSNAKSGDNDFNDLALITQNTNVANVERQFKSLEVLMEVARREMNAKTYEEALHKAESIQGRLTTKLESDKSTIVSITFSATSPDMAERVLNGIVTVYNQKWIDDKRQMAASTSRFIEDRLRLIEQELNSVDDSISKFKTRHKITDLSSVSDIYLQQQSQSDAEILRLTSQRSMAQYVLDILKNHASRYQLLPTNSGIGNAMVEAQINQYNSMLLALKNNMLGTSAQNPLILKQEAEIDEVRRNILATIENQINTFDIQLNALRGYNGEASSKISSNPTQAKHLVSVERDQKVKESLYLYLLQKKEENQISMTYSSVITQMIDMPHGSDKPSSPNSKLTLFAAVLFALIVPVALIFTRECLDNTVRSKSDIEHRTSLSLVGDIPFCALERKRCFPQLDKWLRRKKKKKKICRLVVEHGKQDIVNEAFRYLRSNLEFMTSHHGTKNVYIVMSDYMNSGKTFVSTNLALALAISGKRVLYIDGDLRHATATHVFHAHGKGLADYLAELEDDVTKLIFHLDGYPTLDILPVGTIPPNPTELLAGERLPQLLTEQRPNYDFILIDCPPSDTLADTGLIERHADRTLFVIRARESARRSVEELDINAHNGKYKHVSIVLNASMQGGHYDYHYGYHYGYHNS